MNKLKYGQFTEIIEEVTTGIVRCRTDLGLSSTANTSYYLISKGHLQTKVQDTLFTSLNTANQYDITAAWNIFSQTCETRIGLYETKDMHVQPMSTLIGYEFTCKYGEVWLQHNKNPTFVAKSCERSADRYNDFMLVDLVTGNHMGTNSPFVYLRNKTSVKIAVTSLGAT